MHEVSIGITIAQKRRAAGITQADLARHLDVTKAAVSKWELGQSLPDVSLLPRIAAFFGITLDELFAFRPQMTKDEIRSVYFELCNLFIEDAPAAYARMDELVRDYSSCWDLLLQMAALYMQRTFVEPDRADELVNRSCELVERVEVNSNDVEQVRTARVSRAMMAVARGELDEAIALLESVKPARPLGIEGALAGIYQMKGDREASLKLCQETLFWGKVNIMQSISTQLMLYTDDPTHLLALLRAAEGIMEGFSTETCQPLEAASFCGCAATACLQAGERDRAEAYLERFVQLLERHDEESLLFSSPSVLFDLVPDLTTDDPDLKQVTREGLFGGVFMKEQCKLAVMGEEVWKAVADDERFASLLNRLGAA